jgi:SAM-dependent methyltransferase
MRRFWDRRAGEDAFYFVDNRLDYGRPDESRFWSGGEADLDRLLGTLSVEVRAHDDVVEIGCGLGRLTRPLAARAARVRALDVSPAMLERARGLNPSLDNVEWLAGDGSSLAGIEDASASACVSHVVFQHIPDPRVTLAYVREMGRVLRAEGWAAFQISNDPTVHSRPGVLTRARRSVAASVRRAPRGQTDPAWLGSHVDLADIEAAAADGAMTLERTHGAGTQFCLVLARRGAR